MSDDPHQAAHRAAHELADLGWPVMVVKAEGKEPLTAHGVKDATTDHQLIDRWFAKWPGANIGVACGAPGPQVLDVDRPKAVPLAVSKALGHEPTVATARGQHHYFAGTESATVSLGYGELRGRGSYVICPPSIHPSGKAYVWLAEPTAKLPSVPAFVVPAEALTKAAGDLEPKPLVPHGERHDFLVDIGMRQARGGILEEDLLITIIAAAFTARCDPNPAPKPNEFRDIARFVLKSNIAHRERARAKTAEKGNTESGMPFPPERDAPLEEHRDYVTAGGGWGPELSVADVVRHGNRDGDELDIVLTNGMVIEFAKQAEITGRGGWMRRVTADTNGMALPPVKLKDWERNAIFRSLCILAAAPIVRREREALEDVIVNFLRKATLLTGHTLRDSASRYALIKALREREDWDPRDRNTQGDPVHIVDAEDGDEYVRGGELALWCAHENMALTPTTFPGRMAMAGLTWTPIHGREHTTAERTGRDRLQNKTVLYRLP